MAKEKIGIIPENEYVPDLEKEVVHHLGIAPVYEQNKKKYTRNKQPSFSSDKDRTEWQLQEINRCINGYDGLNGKMYFFLNYGAMTAPKKGLIYPDYRVCQHRWFNLIEECQNSKKYGIVCVKRRRIGNSWLETYDMLNDVSFNKHFKIGMNSKTERDTVILFNRIKFGYDHLPDFLRVRATAGRSRMHMDFAYYIKDGKGGKRKAGNESEIYGVSPTPTAYEGLTLDKLVSDESGKIDCLEDMISLGMDTMMDNTQRTGTVILFGTAGDIDKNSKGLLEYWKKNEIHDLKRFFFAGYNGLILDDFGNDRVEDAIRWIIYERHKKKAASNKDYHNFIQKYPLTPEEAFLPNVQVGIGDVIKINAQIISLEGNPPVTKTGWFEQDNEGKVSFKPDFRGKIIIYEHPDIKKLQEDSWVFGCDPSDHDDAGSEVSDLSTFGMKKAKGLEPPKIIMEYTDRPDKLDEYFEQVSLALLYYNKSRVLVESNRYRMISDMNKMGYGYLLQPTPQGMQRLYTEALKPGRIGVHMTPAMKRYMVTLVEDYIRDHSDLIPSLGLLQEFKKFGLENTDKVFAFGLALMMLQEHKESPMNAEKTKSIFDFSFKRQGGKIIRIGNN